LVPSIARAACFASTSKKSYLLSKKVRGMRPQPRKPGGSRPRCGTRANIDASFFHDPATKAVLKERGRVLMGLLRFHNVNRGAYPGQSKLADESGLPVRSVRRALRELEEADLIRRDGRYRGRARYRLPVSGKNYLKGGADKWDTECAVSTPKSAQFRPPRVRDIDPPGVRDIAHLLNWNHNASRSRTHKEHINTDASILEASQETPSSRGKEESTLPPGAVFRFLPEPPPGTMFSRLVWGAEKILRRRHDTALLNKLAAENEFARRILRQRGG